MGYLCEPIYNVALNSRRRYLFNQLTCDQEMNVQNVFALFYWGLTSTVLGSEYIFLHVENGSKVEDLCAERITVIHLYDSLQHGAIPPI